MAFLPDQFILIGSEQKFSTSDVPCVKRFSGRLCMGQKETFKKLPDGRVHGV